MSEVKHKQKKVLMMKVEQVASYIYNRYQEKFKEKISEMKLHKLLYFTQRESIIQKGDPMFEEAFLAWRYGPVIVKVRSLYANSQLDDIPSEEAVRDNQGIFDFVFDYYAPKDAWSLSILSHGEYSWSHARGNLQPNENCNVPLAMEDIRKDAERIKLRRFLLNEIQRGKEACK